MKRGVLVEFNNATKQFGDLRVMEGLNVQFFEGEIHVVSGQSGAWKRSILRGINGL